MDNEYPSDVEDDNITYSPLNSRKIGQFHTLCNGVPSGTTAIVPVGELSAGDLTTVCSYFSDKDSDFIDFYTKTIDTIYNGPKYNVATVLHPLAGFNAGDILPESVWCLSFHPSCKNWDGMVYCIGANIVVDIYLNTSIFNDNNSVYGSSFYLGQTYINLRDSLLTIGKRLILNPSEFFSISIGSNQGTMVSSDVSITGGNVDTNGRRIISFIGCEDCIGVSNQYLEGIYGHYDSNPLVDWSLNGKKFGSVSDPSYINMCGGSWMDLTKTGAAEVVKEFGSDNVEGNVCDDLAAIQQMAAVKNYDARGCSDIITI